MPRQPKRPITPRKHPRQDRSRETMTAILEGAAQVLGERGYWKATTNEVAQRAGVSVGTLYEYFPNKDALVAALLEDHLTATRAMLDTIAERVLPRLDAFPVDRLTQMFVDAVTAQHERDPALHQVLFEQVPLAPELVARSDALEAHLVELVAEILRRHPGIDVPDPKMSAAIAVYTIEALTHKLVIHPTPGMDREVYSTAVAAMVAAHLTAEPPPPGDATPEGLA